MADVVAFPVKKRPSAGERYRPLRVVGQQGGLTVRILSRIGSPHDLIVVLDGTPAGSTTVALLPEGEIATAEATSQCVLATLQAAEAAWEQRGGRVAHP